MKLNFTIESKVAQKVWDNFERDLIHKLARLPKKEREEISQEILSHLYDSACHDEASLEEVKMINAIDRLGSPDDYLTPLVEDILLSLDLAKGHPVAILNSLRKAGAKGFMHLLATMVFGFGYFSIIMLFIMATAHIANPDVGVWLHNSGSLSLSFGAQPDSIQWQPEYFSVIGGITSVFAYWGLNKLLNMFISGRN